MSDPKDKILQAASALLLNGGPNALSVRAIATRAGISTIGIYSHFSGKQGILDALYIEGFNMVTLAMTFDTNGMTAKEIVLCGAKNYFKIAEENEAHYRLIFGESDDSYHPSLEAKGAGAKAFAKLTKLVSGLLNGTSDLSTKQNAAMQIWAITHGYISLHHHLVNDMMDLTNWKDSALAALEVQIDALEKHR